MRTTIVLTKRCGLRCPYCHIHKSDTVMKEDVLFRAIDMAIAPSNPVAEIHFFGGEPLGEKQLLLRGAERAVTQARRLGRAAQIHVSTNCLDVDRRFVRAIKGMPFSFELSIDGSHGWTGSPDTKPGRFKDAVRRAALLIQSGAECFVNMVVTPETVPYLARNFEDLLVTGAARVNISPATGVVWTRAAAETLAAGLWEIYGIHVKSRRIRLINLENDVDDMLFNREVTVDCGGTVYSGNAFLYCTEDIARKFILGHVDDGLPAHVYHGRRLPLSFYVENVFPTDITLSYSNIIRVLKSFRMFAAKERLDGRWSSCTIKNETI